MKKYTFGFLLFFTSYIITSLTSNSYGQDLISLRTGEQIEVKIISIFKRNISFYILEDGEKKVHKLNRKQIKWFRPESWTKKRISFSFSFGGVPYGTSTSLKRFMEDNGYLGSRWGWFGTITYPISHVKIPWMLEIGYLFKIQHGFSIGFAQANNGSVEGYLAPEIIYKNPQLLGYYKFYSNSLRANIQAGFLLNFSSFSSEAYNYSNSRNFSATSTSKTSLGLLIGFAGSIVEKEKFFLRFQTQFKYVPPIKFASEDGLLSDEKIGLSSLFIGIQTGFKIYPGKK